MHCEVDTRLALLLLLVIDSWLIWLCDIWFDRESLGNCQTTRLHSVGVQIGNGESREISRVLAVAQCGEPSMAQSHY